MAIAEAYASEGYWSPVDVLTADEAAAYRAALEHDEERIGGRFLAEYRHKPHLVATWAWELVHHRNVLDAVEAVIGPDILCWESALFIKAPRSPSYISWHQDLTYWGLDADRVVTAWLALSPSTPASGCMRVVPGSHQSDVLPHNDTFDADNLLSRGQEIVVDVDEADAVDLSLRPGQASLHHVKIFHGSAPNRSDDRRIGLAMRFLPPDLRQVKGEADSATLVRGRDRFGHFEHERRPAQDYAPDAVAAHARARDRRMQVLMR